MACVQVFGQNNLGKTDDIGRISLSVYIPDQVEGLPEISKDFLASKLGQIVSESGFGSSSMENRFIITPSIASHIVITDAETLGYIFINTLVGNDLGGE